MDKKFDIKKLIKNLGRVYYFYKFNPFKYLVYRGLPTPLNMATMGALNTKGIEFHTLSVKSTKIKNKIYYATGFITILDLYRLK